MSKTLPVVAMLLALAGQAFAQPCPDVRTAPDRHAAALKAATCLGDPNPVVRDGLAFESLSAVMRESGLEPPALRALRSVLLDQLRKAGASTILQSFSALALSEVARTDRLKAWMTEAERQELVDAAATFLAGVRDYRAFSDTEGFVHAVAHGADFALQLTLNTATTRAQLDRLLSALAAQVCPSTTAYWAGEPDRIARAVLFIAQRKLHSDAEWKEWFAKAMDPAPLAAWDAAFRSEAGIRKHHNARAFLLSVFATATTTEDPGMRQLLTPARESLKLVP